MLEIVVTPRSPLVGRTPAESRFNRRYGVNLLAASRSGTPHRSRLRDFVIRVGDVLLLHGDEDALQDATENTVNVVLFVSPVQKTQ